MTRCPLIIDINGKLIKRPRIRFNLQQIQEAFNKRQFIELSFVFSPISVDTIKKLIKA